ncbi:MAG TPA: S4 domain-containing protein, partial [Polyangia bacterium]
MAAAPEGRHEVATDEEGLRLDAWLVRRGLATSAAAARRLIADGGVRVEGRSARKGEPVRAGDVVTCAAPEDFVILPEAEAPLEVLFVDEHLVAVAKPAGVPVHPLRAGETGTLAAALIARFPECARASTDPREGGFAHRLDTGTSGAIVAARNQSVYLRLREALAAGLSEKRYLAEV